MYTILKSTRQFKKYMAVFSDSKTVHFGDNRYGQYKDKTKLKLYSRLVGPQRSKKERQLLRTTWCRRGFIHPPLVLSQILVVRFWCGFGESGEAQDTFGETFQYTNSLAVLHSQTEGPVMVSRYPFMLIFLNTIRIINI